MTQKGEVENEQRERQDRVPYSGLLELVSGRKTKQTKKRLPVCPHNVYAQNLKDFKNSRNTSKRSLVCKYHAKD